MTTDTDNARRVALMVKTDRGFKPSNPGEAGVFTTKEVSLRAGIVSEIRSMVLYPSAEAVVKPISLTWGMSTYPFECEYK